MDGSSQIGAATLWASLVLNYPDSIPLEGLSNVGALVLSINGDLSLSGRPTGIELEGSAEIGAVILSTEDNTLILKIGLRTEEKSAEIRSDLMRVFATIAALTSNTYLRLLGKKVLSENGEQTRKDIDLPSIVYSLRRYGTNPYFRRPFCAIGIEIEYAVRAKEYSLAIEISTKRLSIIYGMGLHLRVAAPIAY